MPTPEEILRENARKKRIPIGQTDPMAQQPVISQPQAPATDFTSQYIQAGQQAQQNINNAYADLAKANADALAQQQEANAQREQSFAKMMQEQRDAYNARLAENNVEEANVQKATRWAGATELASNIVNLLGTSLIGAENQQYQAPSADWMKRLDAKKEANKQYKDQMRDKMHSLQLQLDNLRAGNLNTSINMQMQGAKDAAQGRIAAAQQAQQNALGVIDLQHKLGREEVEDANKERSLRLQERAQSFNEAKTIEQQAMTAAQHGLVKGEDGKYTYDPTQDASVAAAAARAAASGGGSGKNTNLITVTLPAFDHDPQETIQIDAKSLAVNIIANSKQAKQVYTKKERKRMKNEVPDVDMPGVELNDEDYATVDMVKNGTLKGEDAATAMSDLVAKYPEIRDAVRKSAKSVKDWGYAPRPDSTPEPKDETGLGGYR